jgi:polysaccharide export outer membrane protein
MRGPARWLTFLAAAVILSAGSAATAGQRAAGAPRAAIEAAAAPVSPEYIIGCDDVLTITFWKDKEMTTEVIVRPDGRITLPLLNDVMAAGLSPEQLRRQIAARAQDFMPDPSLTVTVKAINSRKVFITGQVAHPGPYPLTRQTTVLQLVSIAGGLTEYADAKKLVVLRTENGRQVSYRVNYKDLARQVNVAQNIWLQPFDTVIVP